MSDFLSELNSEQKGLNKELKQFEEPFSDPELAKAFLHLVDNLGTNLPKYDVIVGDDASGRIPALVVWHFANKYRETNGLSKTKLVFINYGIEEPEGELLKSLEKRKGELKSKKVLIVTEFMSSGRSAEGLAKSIQTT